MARYRRYSMDAHTDPRVRALSRPGPSARVLYDTIVAGEVETPVPGLLSFGQAGLAEYLGWPLAGFRRAWAEVEAAGLAAADWPNRIIWSTEGLRHDPPSNACVVARWRAALNRLPECPLKGEIESHLAAYAAERGADFVIALRTGEAPESASAGGKESGRVRRKAQANHQPKVEPSPQPSVEPNVLPRDPTTYSLQPSPPTGGETRVRAPDPPPSRPSAGETAGPEPASPDENAINAAVTDLLGHFNAEGKASTKAWAEVRPRAFNGPGKEALYCLLVDHGLALDEAVATLRRIVTCHAWHPTWRKHVSGQGKASDLYARIEPVLGPGYAGSKTATTLGEALQRTVEWEAEGRPGHGAAATPPVKPLKDYTLRQLVRERPGAIRPNGETEWCDEVFRRTHIKSVPDDVCEAGGDPRLVAEWVFRVEIRADAEARAAAQGAQLAVVR